MFDTQKILVRPSGTEGPTFANARWSDNLPKLLTRGSSRVRERKPPADGNASDGWAHGRLSTPDRYSQLPTLDVRRTDADVEFAAKISQ